MKTLLLIKDMPYDKAVVSYGRLVVDACKSSVTLLHLVSGEREQAAGEKVLQQAVDILGGLPVETRLMQGDSVAAILNEAQEGDYNMVVIGARQAVGLMRRSLGPVGKRVYRRAPMSVLVVKKNRPQLKRVLACTSGIDAAEAVIESGARIARAAQAEATLLHVGGSVPQMYTGLDWIKETAPDLLQSDTPIARHLNRGLDIFQQEDVKAVLRVRQGVAEEEILREARKGDYDLIVIGASGATGRMKGWLLLGDVAERVVKKADRPVLVIRHMGTPILSEDG
jgi:nucleotide-binding universal stress UspA family protein